MTVIAFFNDRAGVGKTTLVYHLAWMFADLGVRVVVADLDPQAHLTSRFLTDEQITGSWMSGGSILGALQSVEGIYVQRVSDRIGLLPGDLALNQLEENFSHDWLKCLDADLDRSEQALRRLTAPRRLLDEAARDMGAPLVLVDVGSNLSAISRAAYINSNRIVMPLGADLFSLRGLPGLGKACENWRTGLGERYKSTLTVPLGLWGPLFTGYVVMSHVARPVGLVGAQEAMRRQIQAAYERHVSAMPDAELPGPRHYPGLMQLSQAARKPIFHLTAADGAIGSHAVAVRDSYEDFERLAREIARRCGIELPE